MIRKEPEGTFQGQGKAPIIERIAHLIERYPSRSAAARSWGINVNTLNSYFKNVENPPTPRKNVLRCIVDKEEVSLAWLLHGEFELPRSPELPNKSPCSTNDDPLSEMLSFLTLEERKRLAVVFARKGVETTLQLLFEFASLSPSEFERAIRLAKQIKEGSSSCGIEPNVDNQTSKQVG